MVITVFFNKTVIVICQYQVAVMMRNMLDANPEICAVIMLLEVVGCVSVTHMTTITVMQISTDRGGHLTETGTTFLESTRHLRMITPAFR